MEKLKDIVVIYHDQCRDGFGSAYAAWKKFGDTASYLPRLTQTEPPDGLANKELYILDYSYPQAVLEQLCDNNRSVVVIDHHETARAAVTSFPENVFDNDHSAAVLSWRYFHPDTEVPLLLQYIEDHDLWKLTLPHTREFGAALGEYEANFETWDQLAQNLSDRDHYSKFISLGTTIARFEDRLVEQLFSFREKAQFEGHEIYVLNAARIYRSVLGHKLASLNEAEGNLALGIVYYRSNGAINCSLRSNGDVDVAAIAETYGGGGHKNAASIRVPTFADLPFTFLK